MGKRVIVLLLRRSYATPLLLRAPLTARLWLRLWGPLAARVRLWLSRREWVLLWR